MLRLERLRRTSRHEWRLLAEATWLVARIRAALLRRPFEAVHRRYAAGDATADPEVDAAALNEARSVGLAVRRASRLVPGATCLPRALATRVMLERRGIPNALRFGVAKSAAGELEAHAWIEVDGRVVVGDLPDLERYARMPSFPVTHG